MANFSRPSIHSVDRITAVYSPQHRYLELTLSGSSPFTGPETVVLDVFLTSDVHAEYGARLDAAVKAVNDEFPAVQEEEECES